MQLDMHVVVWRCDFLACTDSGGVFYRFHMDLRKVSSTWVD